MLFHFNESKKVQPHPDKKVSQEQIALIFLKYALKIH